MKKRESHLHDPVKSVVPLREICGTTIRVNLWDTTPCVSCPLQPFLPLDVTTTAVTIIFSISFALSMFLLWESTQACVYIYSIIACLRHADGKQSNIIFTTTETTGRTGATVYVTGWHTTVTTRLLLPTHFPRKFKETSRQLVNFSQVIILRKLNIYIWIVWEIAGYIHFGQTNPDFGRYMPSGQRK